MGMGMGRGQAIGNLVLRERQIAFIKKAARLRVAF
jgi:hypothetical protein